jgi:pilus assembly protein FimV
MTAHSRTAFPAALATLLAAIATDAGAVSLGDLAVRSALGEPLDATVALDGATAKPQAGCIRQAAPAGAELPALPRATLAIEPDGAGWRLRLRTRTAIREPATRLRLDAACEGTASASRTYEVLLDPRAPEAPAPPMRTMPGDTLASIAAAIYPNRRAVAEAYVATLRAANPALAGLAPDEPIAPDSPVLLPDLRRFSLSLAVPAAGPRAPAVAAAPSAPARASERPKPPPAQATGQPRGRPAPPPRPAAPPATAQDAKPQPPAAAAPPQRPATPKAGAPVLRLSSAEIDLSRSRGIDDRTRAQLRERLLILDADDQVAALLSMRHSLRQLEGRVAELQLKLSALPAQAPGPSKALAEPVKAPAPAKAVEPAKVPEPPPVKAPEAAKSPEPPKAPEPAKAAAPPAKTVEPAAPVEPASAPEPAKVADHAPAPDAASPPVAPAAKPATAPAPRPPVKAIPAPAEEDGVPAWLWSVLALAVAGIAAVAWRLLSAPRKAGKAAAPAPAATPAGANSDLAEAEAMMRAAAPPSVPEEHRVVVQSDQALATSIPGADPVALRRRYIEERFPEIASGTIAPTDPDSVVKAARLFYEDGALARAVELLQFSVEENPRNLKPWLALFEIFRLEGLAGEFGELAGRFQRFHGTSEYWGKVQFIGREIDSGNALYREVPAEQLETIGPVASRKAAPATFDPLAENWLNAPMDFTKDGLAAGMRAGLLADAGLAETDLADDPMPALKNVEMFNVA